MKTANVQTLKQIAFLANQLAKQVASRDRKLAYQIKSAALSALIISGAATPNGIRPDATIGLNILGDSQSRLHVPIGQLQPDAQAIIRRQSGSIPKVASVAQRLKSEDLNVLMSRFQNRAA